MSEKPDNFLKRGVKSTLGYVAETFRLAGQKIDSMSPDVDRKIYRGPHRAQENKDEEEIPERFLNAETHGWYMGGINELNILRRIGQYAILPDEKGPLYNTQFIEASLHYLFAHLQEGEKAQFFVGRSFSEIFNGKESVKNSLPEEELIKLIYKIAKEKFGKGPESLEVKSLESEHESLFGRIRRTWDHETDSPDIGKAYGEYGEYYDEVPDEDHDGLYLAYIVTSIYDAIQKNSNLREMFLNMVPKENGLRSKVREELKTNQNAPGLYYGVTEVAIRLSDLLNGRSIQGGAGRQGVYDSFISKVVRGKTGIPELADLETQFAFKKFETLHLKTRSNPYKRSVEKHQAKVRRAIMLVLGITMLTTPIGKAVYTKVKNDHNRRDKIALSWKAQAAEATEGMAFCSEGKWCAPETENPDIFLRMADEAMVQVKLRYPMPVDSEKELLNLLRASILKKKEEMPHMYRNDEALINFVDEFVHDNLINTWFAERGITPEEPYANLRPYKKLLLETAKMKLEKDEGEIEEENNLTIDLDDAKYEGTLKKIGGFSPTDTYSYGTPKYELYIYTDPEGNEILMAKDAEGNKIKQYIELKKSEKNANGRNNEEVLKDLIKDAKYEFERWRESVAGEDNEDKYSLIFKGKQKVSTAKAKQVAKEYIDSMRIYSILRLRKYNQIFDDFCKMAQTASTVLRVPEEKIYKYDRIGRFEDPLGEFAFDLAKIEAYIDETGEFGTILLAKYPEEKVYTTERAWEASARFIRIFQTGWYSAPKPEDQICTPPNGKKLKETDNIYYKAPKAKKKPKKIEPPKEEPPRYGPPSPSQKSFFASHKIPGVESVIRQARLQTRRVQYDHRRLNRSYRT